MDVRVITSGSDCWVDQDCDSPTGFCCIRTVITIYAGSEFFSHHVFNCGNQKNELNCWSVGIVGSSYVTVPVIVAPSMSKVTNRKSSTDTDARGPCFAILYISIYENFLSNNVGCFMRAWGTSSLSESFMCFMRSWGTASLYWSRLGTKFVVWSSSIILATRVQWPTQVIPSDEILDISSLRMLHL